MAKLEPLEPEDSGVVLDEVDDVDGEYICKPDVDIDENSMTEVEMIELNEEECVKKELQSVMVDEKATIATGKTDASEPPAMSWDQLYNLAQNENADVFLLPEGDNTDLYSYLNIPGAENAGQENDIIIIEDAEKNDPEFKGPKIEADLDITDHVELLPADTDDTDCNEMPEIKTEAVSPFSEVLDPPCMKQLKNSNNRIRQMFKGQFRKSDMKKEPKKSTRHECNMCDRVFVHASGLKRHIEKHANDAIPSTPSKCAAFQAVISCLVCGRVFPSANLALKHLTEDHFKKEEPDDDDDDGHDRQSDGDGFIEEPDIPSSGERLAPGDKAVALQDRDYSEPAESKVPNLADYIKAAIVPSVLQCEFCDNVFDNAEHLLAHEKSHDPADGFECRMCDIKVVTSKMIALHWLMECTFKSDAQFGVSVQKHFLCNICSETFKSLDVLYAHRYNASHLLPRCSHANPDIFHINCEVCGSLFKTAKTLFAHYKEEHLKTTSHNKPQPSLKTRMYLCDVCGKSYTQSSHLWQHLRFHKGVKPFSCTVEGCTRKFTIRPDLNDHIRKCHTGERPYQCLVCGKRFLTGSVFYQHRLIHRGERRYGCETCDKRFYRADALKNHARIHTGEKPYPCDYCSKAFRQRGDKEKHMRARHFACMNQGFVKSRKTNAPIPVNMPSMTPMTKAMKKEMKKEKAEAAAAAADGIVYVGDVPFPQSMFQPIMNDIDEN